MDLGSVSRSAVSAYAAVAFAHKSPLRLPGSDVGHRPATSPEDGLVSGLGRRLAEVVALAATDHVAIRSEGGELHAAGDAGSRLGSTLAPSPDPVAGGRAVEHVGLGLGSVVRRSARWTGALAAVPWAVSRQAGCALAPCGHLPILPSEAEYVRIAEARLNGTQRGLGLDVGAPTPKMPNTHPDLSKHQPKQRAAGENYSGRWAGTPPEEVA
jgi:hypothetical protein